MDKRLEIEKYENPAVKIIWDGYQEDFTKERKLRVKDYFRKKYNTNNVTIITRSKAKDEYDLVLDVSSDVRDLAFQRELIQNLLASKGQMSDYNTILELDTIVEEKIIQSGVDVAPFKKWYIKNIKFSNFLSFGKNQILNYDDYDGLVIVESVPQNTGGKTILTVDLLLFLFFNTTTKSTKAEDIFNTFTDDNEVFVQGEVMIDGCDYIITRTLKREYKMGAWKVSSTLDFTKRLPNGTLVNENGEQRRETEAFIRRSIGSMEDFLMTIMTTASNLEDLLESKPTARGQIFSKFLGFEHLKKKEEACKEIYQVYSKTMLSNVFNKEKLKEEVLTYQNEINNLNELNNEKRGEIKILVERINKGEEYKDSLIHKKFNDINEDLVKLNPGIIEEEINKLSKEKEDVEGKIKLIDLKKPSIFYNEDEYDQIKDEIKNLEEKRIRKNVQILDIEKLIKEFSSEIKCDHCGLKITEAALTKSKIESLPEHQNVYNDIVSSLEDLKKREQSYIENKKEFDLYERNKLIMEKFNLTVESLGLKISKNKEILKNYYDVQEKIKKNIEIENMISKAKFKLDELSTAKLVLERDISINENKIDNLQNKIGINNDNIIKIDEEYEKERIYKLYMEVFGKNGITKLIMRTMLPYINRELEILLEDTCNFKLDVRINDKNEVEFIMIDNSTGVEKLMSTGSGFERTISSMALRAVLSKVCSLPKPNIWVADEVFGKVAVESLEYVVTFLKKLTTYFDKIFLISFNPLLNNWADHVLRVEKRENISRIL